MKQIRNFVAAALLAVVPVANAEDHPLLGTWTGWLTQRSENELTVHHVENVKHVYGYYCVRQPGVMRWYDFVPGGVTHGSVAARARGRSIRTTIGKFHLRFRRSGKAVSFEARRSKTGERVGQNELVRNADGPCLQRLHPLRPPNVVVATPPGATVAERIASAPNPTHPIMGSWIGTRPSGLRIELNVIDVAKDGSVTGLYCNTTTDIWRAYDLGADVAAGTVPVATDRSLSWTYHDRQFKFSLKGESEMTYVQIRPTGTRTLSMTRTTSPPCAQRVVALDDSGTRL